MQHAGEAQRIDIALRLGAVSETESGGAVLLRVRDHGEGIEQAQLASLFEPFAKGGQSGGAGLGLAIARRAVLVHGGSIRAKNAADGGVEMLIELPLGELTS